MKDKPIIEAAMEALHHKQRGLEPMSSFYKWTIGILVSICVLLGGWYIRGNIDALWAADRRREAAIAQVHLRIDTEMSTIRGSLIGRERYMSDMADLKELLIKLRDVHMIEKKARRGE